MIKPELLTTDDALEYAAQLIEDLHFGDLGGIMAKKKRDREDAALRVDTIKNARKEMAAHIRAFKDRPDLSLITLLREAANLCGVGMDDSILLLRGGWQLAAKGWVKVTMTVECTTNQIPAPVHFEVRMTDKGRAVLTEADAAVATEEQVRGIKRATPPPPPPPRSKTHDPNHSRAAGGMD